MPPPPTPPCRYFGGFIFLEEQASLSCEGATIEANTAGDQGGGIYARDATWVNSSCDLVGNWAPEGAAAYLTNTIESANLRNHSVTGGSTTGGGGGGSVVYVAETSVFATGVNFQSEAGAGGQEQEQALSGLAVRLEGAAELVAEGCVFAGWAGEAVVQSASPKNGSLVLDSCDFSESSATMAVSSPNSDAEIRNAYIGDLTVQHATIVDGEPLLVDRAIGCDDPEACGVDSACVDSALGVLCQCLDNGECLDDGGGLSVELETPPPTVTYYPDPVVFKLLVSAAADGTTSAIWELESEADMAIQAVPSSGVLPPGEAVTVSVTGTPQQDLEVGGKQSIRFSVTSVVADIGGASDSIMVEADLFLCPAFEYFDPNGENKCEQCASISGAEGLDCSAPGATLTALPVRRGYWRSSRESKVVHACLHSDACAGGAALAASSDDYCAEGYSGPCEYWQR